MDIINITSSENNDSHSLKYTVKTSDDESKIWVESSHPITLASDAGNAVLCASLLPAMKLDEPIHLPLWVDPQLLNNTASLQDVFKNWYKELSITTISTHTQSENKNEARRGTGLFFSGGIDSFYTLEKNKNNVTHIIYVYGFDIRLDEEERSSKTSVKLRNIAKELDIELIEIKTNLREFSDQHSPWGSHYHGSALAMIGHLLTPSLDKIYISSDFTYSQMHPWGSHILTAPLWNTEHSEQIFFGMDTPRFKKCEAIAENQLAREFLGVCWEHKNSNYNCGECEKCVRTMTSLYIINSLQYFSCFKNKLSADLIKKTKIGSQASHIFTKENLFYSAENKSDSEIQNALISIINKYELKEIFKESRRFTNAISLLCDDNMIRNQFIRELTLLDYPWLVKETIKAGIKNTDQKFLRGLLSRFINSFK